MQMHKNGQTVDVQPRSVAHWEAQGWSRGAAPKPEQPDEPSDATSSWALDALNRDQLNEQARQLGVESPESLPNKAAVKAAIQTQSAPSGDTKDTR